MGEKAIHLTSPPDQGDDGDAESHLPAVVVEPAGCIGCGVCEFYCPADPRGIIVQPHR